MAAKVVKPMVRPGSGQPVPPSAARKPAPTRPQAQSPVPPSAAKGGPVPPSAAKGGPVTLVVSSKAKRDDIGLETLVGEYVESGKNHGRSYFKRKPGQNGAPESLVVFLYFWDMRDGADFSGWWFGDRVGGTQVWSRCEKADQMPPVSGWRVPWDGQVQPDLVVEPKAAKAAVAVEEVAAKEEVPVAKEELADVSAVTGEIDERVQRATDRVVLAEIEATQALESVHAMLEGEVTEDNLRVVEELLQAQSAAMTEAHKTLSADIIDARKTAPKIQPALHNLTPRVRSVQASIAREVKHARELVSRKKQEAEELRLKAKAEEAQAKAEQRDAKALEEALPAAQEVVTQAEDTLDIVLTAASPLAVDYSDEMTEAALLAIKETEAAVEKSSAAIRAAYSKITQCIKAAKDYAPEAKKVALTEYSALQEKLSEAKKKLTPYEKIRRNHEMKLESKKMMTEVTQKMGIIEVEVEKVTGMLVGAGQSEEAIKSAETQLPPVSASLTTVMKLVEQRLQEAQLSLREELLQMQERGKEAKKRVDAFKVELRSLRAQLEVQLMLRQGLEKTVAAEEILEVTAAAEAPFIKGNEMVPGPEATAAISAAKEAAVSADSKVHQAKAFLKAKLADAARFPEASQASIVDELSQLQSRVEVVAQKVVAFKRESAQHEAAILLTEVTQKVAEAERNIKRTIEVSGPLAADKLEELGVAKLKEAAEQTMEAEKAAALAYGEARKMLATKQKEAQVKESPGYAAELVKLEERLKAVQVDLTKQRKVAVQGEKLWKSTLTLQTKEDEMKKVESEVEKAELLTTPIGDERPSNESILEMDQGVNAAQETLTEMVTSLEEALQTAQGSLKAQLTKLLGRAKRSQEQIDEMKATTREQRERVNCQAFLQEAKAKLDAVDAAFMKVAEAEVPYLKGLEILPLEESTKAVADSEAAIVAVQKVLNDAKSFIVAKTSVVKGFVESVSTRGVQDMDALSNRTDECKEKLLQFMKETEGRKRLALEQQAEAKVIEAEEAVQRAVQASASLQTSEEFSQEVAGDMVTKLGEAEEEAQEKLEEARKFLLERQRDRKARMDQESLKKLVDRLTAIQGELTNAKAAGSEHEQRFVSKLLLKELADLVKNFESELERANEAAVPLIVEGGKSFVVASMAKMLLDALNELCGKEKLSKEALFAKITPGSSISEVDFTTYLEKVPQLCSRADLAFSSEQRQAIFEQLDADKDGSISKADFVNLFLDRFICTQEVPITDGFDPSQSKTIDTLLIDDVVESLGEQKSFDAMSLIRMEVRVLKDGSKGWVTMQGSQGATFFSPFTAYTSFIKRLDRTVSSTQATATKVASFVASKTAEVREVQQGPLLETKTELASIRPKVNSLRGKLDQLVKKVEEGKREHAKREELERRKQEEKKERKAASLVLSTVSSAVDRVQAQLKKLEKAAAPFSVAEPELASMEKPLTLSKGASQAADVLFQDVAEARETVKTNEGRIVQAARGPWYDAKQDLLGTKKNLDALEKKGRNLLASIQSACAKLTEAKLGQVSAALRADVQAKSTTGEALFTKLAGKGKDKIPEATLGKHLDSLKDCKLTQEQKQLLFQKSGPDGITRRSFFAMLERYFRVVKEIALTSDFDIKSGNTLRKLEPQEFVQVLEGPRSDSSLGLARIQAKTMSDGKVGWITAKGNQGTPFLVEAEKPCYVATEPLTMQDSFATEGCKDVRKIKQGEVLEVIEGPRKEVIGNAVRARGKATSDGAEGWFTVRSKQGEEMVQPGKSTFTCRQSIALTNVMSIKDCEVLRKLDRGEILMILEGPAEDESAAVTRIKARAVKDDQEGWVTTKGNAGSVYVEETGRTFIVSTSMPLQTKFQTDSATDVRMLAQGETIELLEGPKEEKQDAPVRVNVRAVTDGKSGWVPLRKTGLKRWSSSYKCVAEVALTEAESEKSKVIRNLAAAEKLELLEGPKEVGSSLRLRARAKKDGAVGWATVIDGDGQSSLENVPPS